MVKSSLYFIALIFFVSVAIAGFINDFSPTTILVRGSVFALFMLLWGVVVVIISAIVKSEVEAKFIAEEDVKKIEYTTGVDKEEE